jgi:hypothetical protein
MSGKLLGKERMVTRSFRATPDELRKFAALGGGAWVRRLIQNTPRGSKVARRPRTGGPKVEPQSFRAEPAQVRKFSALGGAVWLREMIDATPWPRGTKK